MTDNTQTIEDLKKELEELKSAKVEELNAQAEERRQKDEMAELKRQIESLKAGVIPETSAPRNNAVITPTEGDVKLAAVRQGLAGFVTIMTGPIGSIVYGAKTGFWTPTLAATGVAVIGVPFALIDFGLTTLIGAPVCSTILLCTASTEKRRKLGITLPYEADEMMRKFRTF